MSLGATGDGRVDAARDDRRPAELARIAGRLPRPATTRYAPAPTGYLHLGHVLNAAWVWAAAEATTGQVLLRIEDHDRQRSRPAFDAALREDLDWLGFVAGLGRVRQTDPDALAAYRTAFERLRSEGLAYGCLCSRSAFAAWATDHAGRRWTGPGCPGGCQARGLDGPVWRVALGDGDETWVDARLGPRAAPVAPAGDLPIRDRDGDWTYGFCVVIDDARQGIDLVVRGEDLLEATPAQIRLGRRLGRLDPPTFLHHPLIRRADGRKLSKSDADTGVRDLRAAGWTPARIIAAALEAGARALGSDRDAHEPGAGSDV